MRRTQHKVYIPVNTNKQRYKVTIRPDTSRMGIGYFKKVGGMEWVCKKLSMIYINVTAAQDYLEEVQDAIAKYNLKLDNLGKYAADSVKSNMRFIVRHFFGEFHGYAELLVLKVLPERQILREVLMYVGHHRFG